MEVKLTRRDFIKSNAVAAAAVSAGVAAPGTLLVGMLLFWLVGMLR